MERTSSGSLMIQRLGDIYIIEFMQASILDQSNIEKIKDELLKLVETAGYPKFVLSFEHVRHISSAVLGMLMAVNKQVKAAGGELRLAAIDKQLMEVFKLTRLDKVLKIYKDSPSALHKF